MQASKATVAAKRRPATKPGRDPSSRSITYLVALALTLLAGALLSSCSAKPPAEDDSLATEDVAPGLELSIDEDTQATARKPSLSGVLPGDFPQDLPLHLPASLIDFSQEDDPERSITLFSPDPSSKVRASLEAKLAAAGWSLSPEGAGSWTLGKGSRRAHLSVEDARPGTQVRIRY